MKRYYLVKYPKCVDLKKGGGLGVQNLRKQNVNLLMKWWWKPEKGQRLWQEAVRAKYLKVCIVSYW